MELSAYIASNRSQPGGDRGITSFTPVRYLQAIKYFPREVQTVLDVGCGKGTGGKVLHERVKCERVIGMDCIPERVEAARAVYDEVIEGSAAELCIEERSVCVIVACELIEHLTDQDATLFVAKAARALRPGGRLVITTPNPSYLRLWLTGRSVLDDPAHLSKYKIKDIKRLMSEHGLKTICVKGTGRVSNMIGTHWPVPWIYGSYMLVAEKPN